MNPSINLTEKISSYLNELCVTIPNRHVGSPGNRQATDFFAQTIGTFGFTVEMPEFDCIEWEYGDVHLQVGNQLFLAHVSPYSLAFDSAAPLIPISTIEELEKTEIGDKIVLLCGEIAKEQLFPKNFTFYNPERHQNIYRLLEEKAPAAIITATGKNPEIAGGMYPFPMIEDGDFHIPSVYMKDVDGDRLKEYAGQEVTLRFESHRIPATGCNVIARKGKDSTQRIVCSAHIDAKKGTPGALDDASGIAILLALAELLEDYSGDNCVDIVAMNGEDYYSNPGEMQYFTTTNFEDINLAINIDGAGFRGVDTAYSFYECSDALRLALEDVFANYAGIKKGNQWYQGDHMLFVIKKRPAVAITSENFMELSTNITHTEKDTPDLVDCAKLAGIARSLRDVVAIFNQQDKKL